MILADDNFTTIVDAIYEAPFMITFANLFAIC